MAPKGSSSSRPQKRKKTTESPQGSPQATSATLCPDDWRIMLEWKGGEVYHKGSRLNCLTLEQDGTWLQFGNQNNSDLRLAIVTPLQQSSKEGQGVHIKDVANSIVTALGEDKVGFSAERLAALFLRKKVSLNMVKVRFSIVHEEKVIMEHVTDTIFNQNHQSTVGAAVEKVFMNANLCAHGKHKIVVILKNKVNRIEAELRLTRYEHSKTVEEYQRVETSLIKGLVLEVTLPTPTEDWFNGNSQFVLFIHKGRDERDQLPQQYETIPIAYYLQEGHCCSCSNKLITCNADDLQVDPTLGSLANTPESYTQDLMMHPSPPDQQPFPTNDIVDPSQYENHGPPTHVINHELQEASNQVSTDFGFHLEPKMMDPTPPNFGFTGAIPLHEKEYHGPTAPAIIQELQNANNQMPNADDLQDLEDIFSSEAGLSNTPYDFDVQSFAIDGPGLVQPSKYGHVQEIRLPKDKESEKTADKKNDDDKEFKRHINLPSKLCIISTLFIPFVAVTFYLFSSWK